jgi:hypothetical protein
MHSKVYSLSVVSCMKPSACSILGKTKESNNGFHSKGVPCATTLKYTLQA